MAEFDDGSGPALYVGGDFRVPGDEDIQNIARWDGQAWSAVGAGVPGINVPVNDLLVFDDGTGPRLWAAGGNRIGGSFSPATVNSWDGTAWESSFQGTALGSANTFNVFDLGSGPRLLVGGNFVLGPFASAQGVAQWDGAEWLPIGNGYLGFQSSDVSAIGIQDFGQGPRLFLGGSFESYGSFGEIIDSESVLRLDGELWTRVGKTLGLGGTARALLATGSGAGARLTAAGNLSVVGAGVTHVAEWDGQSSSQAWVPLGSGVGSSADVLGLADFGSGEVLVIGGSFETAGGAPAKGVATWDGSSWLELGQGVDDPFSNSESRVKELLFDSATGVLHVGGRFQAAGGLGANGVASFNGQDWSSFGVGFEYEVWAMEQVNLGAGPELIAGGPFSSAGGTAARRIASWDGSTWSPLGGGIGSEEPLQWVDSLRAFDEGQGERLFAGGVFSQAGGQPIEALARWDGTDWSQVGGGVEGFVRDMVVFDDGSGPALYVTGYLTQAGSTAVANVARWDGIQWSALGAGLDGEGRSLAVWDPGSGARLYVGGLFTTAGGAGAPGIASWDGTTWEPLPGTVEGSFPVVSEMLAYDDGTQERLVVAGNFTSIGTGAGPYIAQWDGTAWSSLGSGASNWVLSLTLWDDGNGELLLAGGGFTEIGGVQISSIGAWDGQAWEAWTPGQLPWMSQSGSSQASVKTFQVFDEGFGPELWVGGGFVSGPAGNDAYLTRYGCPKNASFDSALGCFGNTAQLAQTAGQAQVGGLFELTLLAQPAAPGAALLYFGRDGTYALGCGLLAPGVGEILLLSAPLKLLEIQPSTAGVAKFVRQIPNDPALVGFEFAYQAVHYAPFEPQPLELSNALLGKVAP